MKHVQQPTFNSCMSACISMITGIDVKIVMSDFGIGYQSRPINQEHLIYKYLIKNCFVTCDSCELSVDGSVDFEPGYYYIVGVPSIGIKGKWHSVVIWFKNESMQVYDPTRGHGKYYYFGESADEKRVDISDVEIQFDVAIKAH